MRRLCIVAWMAVLAMALGCPHAFGRGGTIDEAMLKDAIQEASRRGCPVEEIEELCGDDLYVECLVDCRQRLRHQGPP